MFLVDIAHAGCRAVQPEYVADPLARECAAPRAFETGLTVHQIAKLGTRRKLLGLVTLTVIEQTLGKGLRHLRERVLVVQYHPLCRWSHPGAAQFCVECCLARFAGAFDVLDAQFLLRDDRRPEDRRAMVTVRPDTRPVLGPEGVDNLWTFVAVVLAFFGRHGGRFEVGRHLVWVKGEVVRLNHGRDAGAAPVPLTLVAARAVGDVERPNLRFDLGFDLVEKPLDLIRVRAGQLVLDDEPSDRVEIDAAHLEPQTRALNQCRATAHERVEHLEMLEIFGLLVVGVIHVPDGLGGFGLVRNGGAVLSTLNVPSGFLR